MAKTRKKPKSNIDRRAIISPEAEIDANVTIGPYALVAAGAKIGSGTIIEPFAHILSFTKIGKNCRIFPYAVIGNISQDLKYQGEKGFLEVGDGNIIREFVTMNRSTNEDGKTIVGSNNLFMAYSHVAHDCSIGSNNIFANNATLAGCVNVENHIVVGGLTAVHQFCRIGSYAIIGGCSKVVQDIPPFSMCDGHPAIVYGLNTVGLKRANFSLNAIQTLKKAFKVLFFENHPLKEAAELVKKEFPASKEIDTLLNFVVSSKRGIGR